MPSVFEIRRFQPNTTEWTPITVPIECSRIVVENGDTTNAQNVRTDQNNGDTEKGLPAGQELDIRSPVSAFQPGTIICYVQAVAGSGPVIVSYTR